MSISLRIQFVFVALCLSSVAMGNDSPDVVQSFLRSNCLDCHEGDQADGGLDLSSLDDDLTDPNSMARWERIFDRVDHGEMPPKDAGELDREEANRFLKSVSSWLVETQRQEFARLGRVRSRRLTKMQLERTLHDLLSIDVPLEVLMPDEQRTDGFTNIAEGQSMSHFQLASHLTVVDAALDAAFDRVTDDGKNHIREYRARDLARANPRRRCRDPEMIDGKAVVWNSGLIFYGRVTSTTSRKSGWYRITFKASAVNQPKNHGVWCTVRSGRCTSGAPLLSWIGSFEATEEPVERTFETWLPADHMLEIRPGDATLRRAKFRGGQVGAGEGGPQNVPGVALHSMRIEEIHPGGDVELAKRRLFGDMEVEVDHRTQELRLVSEDPEKVATKQLRVFARRAFRRPVSDAQLKPYLQMLRRSIADGDDPIDALRACYRAVLCSPRFLYFVEPAGALDDHAIASRLSYMLWGSMPDDKLTKLASEGELRDPATLQQSVERMLSGQRSRRFIEDFSGQWLDLVDIDFTEPDRKLFRDFDILVQNAMLEETHQFLQSLLEENASATELVDSDFTYLNSRLARYYDIDGVEGDEVRRVSLTPDSHRGGLMAQGAILKVTANGTNTSPVLRGVWISERILGTPIPPPPESVPAVEPDIRGAKTIREQLQKHLSDVSCAGCHQNIDPPGYALENFDAAGQWRRSYRESGKGDDRMKIDASFQLADGRKFQDFHEFRSLLRSKPRPIARNFAEKLIVYGTGAPITFSDRAVVQDIVDQSADQNYGLRSLLHAVVTSPIFLSK